MFDALYDLVRQKRPLEQPLVDRLNQANGLLADSRSLSLLCAR